MPVPGVHRQDSADDVVMRARNPLPHLRACPDDGRGFDPAQAPQQDSSHGYGLGGIQQRIAALSGTVNIESTPGEGTVVAARIPLTSQHTPAS
ncbi:ATP-binding protein [Corynebacterium sp.]|uniref:ATP-binding protein n=1 Tax=Corynebacterium sp. TaxID=1720 RepID=UPI0027B9710E|nr:ATP-binding protein [Corynebacterium sp.]